MNVQILTVLTPKERIERLYKLNQMMQGMQKMPNASSIALHDARREAIELKKLIKKDVGKN